MDKECGDFVETKHAVNGIIIGIRTDTENNKWVEIATSDMMTFNCKAIDITN